MAARRLTGLWLVLLAGPAQAECMGSCADDLMAALISILVYGLIGAILLIMVIRAKWRRAGLRGLAVVAVLALGVPLVSQAWMGWKLQSVEGREIVGNPPALATRTILLVTPNEYCRENACEAVLRGRGEAGTYVVLTPALDGRDLSLPVALADLPIEVWTEVGASGEVRRRVLTAEERKAAAERIDYLVVTTWPYSRLDSGPIEAALRGNPAVPGMGTDEAVRLLLAPVEPGQDLSLGTIRPDLLDLSLLGRPLAIPLAPRNRQGAGNTPVGAEVAARAVCPRNDPNGNCRWLLEG